MTITEAAEKLGKHPEYVRELCRLGRIRATRKGSQTYGNPYQISAAALRAYQPGKVGRPRKGARP